MATEFPDGRRAIRGSLGAWSGLLVIKHAASRYRLLDQLARPTPFSALPFANRLPGRGGG
jgi:hypothetical protein